MLKDLSALVEVTLGGSVCIFLLLALGPVLAKKFSPRWRYWAWLATALALLALPVLRPVWEGLFPAPVQLPVPQVVAERTAPEYDGMAADEAGALPYGYQGTVVGGDTTYEVWYTDDEQVEHHIYDFVLLRLEGTDGAWAISFRWDRIWAAGAAASLLLLAAGELRLSWLLRKRRGPADPEDREELRRLCRQMGQRREPRLFRAAGLSSPCLVGLFRPAVLLPQEMPAEALSWALAHELTHWRRRDLWYQLALNLARCVHWFNPLVWLMVRAARRDMELCCDYDLLRDRDEEARRAYGRAILDQMTGRDRGFSGLTTGFSGSKREVFARFRAMMDLSPKKKGGAVLALAVTVVLLSGSLVACQEAESPPEESQMGTSEAALLLYAWVESIDREGGTVTYIPMTQEQWDNREDFWDEMGDLERETLPLAQDAGIYHTYDGKRYPLNPTAQIYTLNMSQAGLPGELAQADTGPDAGKVIGIKLDAPSQLDLTAAELDFSGYCGTVYAVGQGGARLLHGRAAVSLDPCNEFGQDEDHAQYTLPLAEESAAPASLRAFLTGVSSARYPALFQFTVVDGEVTAIVGIDEIDSSMGGEVTLLPGDPAWELSREAGRYGKIFPDSGLTASVQEREGTPGLLLGTADGTAQVWIMTPTGQGEPAQAAVSCPGGDFNFEMPVTPLNLSSAAGGMASLDVIDLTGDGSPELVYIWGHGGNGVWEDQCRVFDLSTGEEYPVNVDLEPLSAQVEAELVEAREDVLVYQVAGAGITGLSTLERRSPDQEPGETLVLGEYTSIQLDREQGALELSVSIGVQGDARHYSGNHLGMLVTRLEFFPSLRAFTTVPANGITLSPPAAEP